MRRYLETLFRYKEMFLIPALLVPALALLVTWYTGREYEVRATVWVEPSRFLQPLSSSLPRTTPAGLEAQVMQEWLSTEFFRQEVIDRSGLTAAIEAGQWPLPSRLETQVKGWPVLSFLPMFIGERTPESVDGAKERALDLVKESISISADGNNLLRVKYHGKEPLLGKRLVEEVLSFYNEKAAERQVQDSQVGVEFYTRQVEIQRERTERANQALSDYLSLYPEPVGGQVRPAAELAEVERLRSSASLERTLYESALRKLEEVRVAGEAAISNRNDTFRLVDPPVAPDKSRIAFRKLIMMAMFGGTLGVMVGTAPIILMTWSDTSLRTRQDVEEALDLPLMAQVPLATGGRGRWVRRALAQVMALRPPPSGSQPVDRSPR